MNTFKASEVNKVVDSSSRFYQKFHHIFKREVESFLDITLVSEVEDKFSNLRTKPKKLLLTGVALIADSGMFEVEFSINTFSSKPDQEVTISKVFHKGHKVTYLIMDNTLVSISRGNLNKVTELLNKIKTYGWVYTQPMLETPPVVLNKQGGFSYLG